MGYKLKKSEKHDYAGPFRKLYRKLHSTAYGLAKKREKLYPLYSSYRHRNKKPGSGEQLQYMTELPGYMAGFGHGLGAWRAGLMNAKIFGLEYAYSPMVNREWEEILGLGAGFPAAAVLLKQGYKKVLLPYYSVDSEKSRELIKQIIASYKGKKVIFYNEYEQWTGVGDDIKGDREIKEIFWGSPKRKSDELIYSKDEFNIALHVRRGDVSSRLKQGDESMRRRWLEPEYYLNSMDMLDELHADKNIHYYLFSEGREEDFSEFRAKDRKLTFCLDMPAEKSFLQLCYADVLVTAPSSFSIIAGAWCRGTKYYPDRDWLTIPDTPDWIKLDEQGRLCG
ncbi:MAG: hypothetical protein IKI75_00835 [Lachnospiraceae bacterium]|nr:hypothetical protein [Lachnospiraceae bacterium]